MGFNKLFAFMFVGLFMISFASAIDCWGTFAKDSDIDLIQKCPSCTYVNITSITYPNSTIFLNDAMTKNGTNYNYTLPDSSQVGIITYGTIGDKNGATTPMYEDLCIEITVQGNVLSIESALIYIMFLIFMCGLIFGYNRLSKNVDYDKWYANILRKYEDRNYIKSNLSFIAYGLIRSTFMIYWMLIFVVILLLTDIAFMFNIVSLIPIMEKVVMLYGISITGVAFLFIGKGQELVMKLLDDIKNENWGMIKNEN